MIDSARFARLNESLGAALCASNQLVAQVNGPDERPELKCNRHLVLLLLSQRGATPEDGIAERLRLAPAVLAIELDALEREGLIERASAGRTASVSLTEEGARVHDRIGKQEIRRRLYVLKPEIEALRDLLDRTVRAAEGEARALRIA